MKIRKSLFSGSWYPADASECERSIHRFLKELDAVKIPRGYRIGGIVPHAGWYFSGSIACNVIHELVDEDPVDVILVFGMHLHPGSANYIMVEGGWETPFGVVEIESGIAGALAEQFDFTIETASRFTQDNTIELQLPFVKYFFKDAKIVPMGVPPRPESLEIGKAAADLSKQRGMAMKIIGSTDLTHYGFNYGFMPKGSGSAALKWVKNENDRRFIDAMVEMNPSMVIQEGLENHNACCAGAAATAIAASIELGADRAESIAYATSHDKSPGDSFVGYAGVLMYRSA